MNTTQTANRLHPLVAGAAVSVTVLALVGTAAIVGWLPNSHSAPEGAPATLQMGGGEPTQQMASAESALAPAAPAPAQSAPSQQNARPAQHAAQAAPSSQPSSHQPSARQQPSYAQQAYQQPVPKPAAQPNYLGIGAGAVIGGLLGNQVGGGRGKALATIAGAVGGGMVGNEVQKQAQQ